MREIRFDNLVLGVGHQSPDYQWWLGHPAMDGDLVKIKHALDAAQRETSN